MLFRTCMCRKRKKRKFKFWLLQIKWILGICVQNHRDKLFYPLVSTTRTVKVSINFHYSNWEQVLVQCLQEDYLIVFLSSLSLLPLKQVETIQTAHLQWSKWCTWNLWLLWNSSFKCHIVKHRLSWFPFENSSLGRRESKGGGEEETRTEMLMVRLYWSSQGFYWHSVEAFPPYCLLTHLLLLIQGSITVYQMEWACKSIWCYLSQRRKKPSFSQCWSRRKYVSLVRNFMEP